MSNVSRGKDWVIVVAEDLALPAVTCGACREQIDAPHNAVVTWWYSAQFGVASAGEIVHRGECVDRIESMGGQMAGRGFLFMDATFKDAARRDLLGEYAWGELSGRLLRARMNHAGRTVWPTRIWLCDAWRPERVVAWKSRGLDAQVAA